MAKLKKLQSNHAPIGRDWMKYHPYPVFSSYDSYYLKLSKKVFEYFNSPKSHFRQVFQPEVLKEAAILVTCHFEDFVNEIGIWQTLTRKNKALYGWFIPFYELGNYDPDYLNVQDFAYLLWHHLGKFAKKNLSPTSPLIMEPATFCYEFFEELIDDAPVNDVYEDLLKITPDIYFFALKERLVWMTFRNYLTGPEFNDGLETAIEEFMTESPEMVQQLNPEALIYGMQEDFLFKKNTSWCGLTIPEWLAEIGHFPEELKKDIIELHKRVYGIFLYHGHDEQYYHFEFISSGRVLSIHKKSVEIDVSRLNEGKTLSLFGAVNWRGEWWLSGGYLQLGDADERLDEKRADPENANFYGWTKETQQKIREMTDDMEKAFTSFFGKPLVIFPSQTEMRKAMKEHHDWWNEQKRKENPDGKPNPRFQKYAETQSPNFDQVDFGRDAIGVYFVPQVGVIMSPIIPQVIELLQKKELDERERVNLFYMFFFEFNPSLAHYIKAHYPIDNIQFPLEVEDDFIEKHFDLLLRYYNPEDTGKPVPTLTVIE